MTRKSLPAVLVALLLVHLAGRLRSQNAISSSLLSTSSQNLLSEVLGGLQARARIAVPADMVLINGKIITVDARDSIVEAVAIRNGKIVAVGSTSDIQPLITNTTTVIDLHGRTATPGLIDSHGHFADGGVNEQPPNLGSC